MACPGGCIGGGGNPPKTWSIMEKRKKAIYEAEAELPVRQSHKNPAIQKIYETYLGEPCGLSLSHKICCILFQPSLKNKVKTGRICCNRFVIDLPRFQSAPYGSKIPFSHIIKCILNSIESCAVVKGSSRSSSSGCRAFQALSVFLAKVREPGDGSAGLFEGAGRIGGRGFLKFPGQEIDCLGMGVPVQEAGNLTGAALGGVLLIVFQAM